MEMDPSTVKKDTLTVYKMMWKYIDKDAYNIKQLV